MNSDNLETHKRLSEELIRLLNLDEYWGEDFLNSNRLPFDVLPLAVMICGPLDLDTPILYVNSTFTEITGYDAKEIIGQNCEFLHGEETDQATVQLLHQCLAEEKPFSGWMLNYTKSGQKFWNRLVMRPFRQAQDSPAYYIALSEDISDLVTSRNSLQEAQERYQAAYDSAPIIIWRADVDKKIVELNRAWKDFTGREIERDLGFGWTEVVHKDDLPARVNTYKSSFDKHHRFELKYRILRHDGEYRWVKDCGAPTYDQQGSFTGYIGTCIDITDLLQKNDEIEEARDRYLTLLNGLPDIVFKMDRDGVILDLHSANKLVYEYRPEGYIGYHISEICPQVSDIVLQSISECLDSHSVVEKEVDAHFLDKDCSFEIHFSPSERDGVVVIFRDITRRKSAELEKALLQKKYIQLQKFEGLGVLAGGIAHDFNNLLLSTMGSIDIIERKYQDGEDLSEEIRDIRASSRRAADLCQQLLAYSGQGKVDVKRFDIRPHIRFCIDAVREKLKDGQRLTANVADTPLILKGEKTQIQQVILNVMLNAWEALRGKPGEIQIVADHADLSIEELAKAFRPENAAPGKYICITINDTGEGMDQELLTRIFDPYFSTRKEGRGLGLSAAAGIISNHEGALNIKSIPGDGTRISIYFPFLDQSDDHERSLIAPIDQEDTSGKTPKTVLFADDEDIVRKVTRKILEHYGYVVISARDGAEALKVYHEHRDTIDLCIFDVVMPEMNGVELSTKIHEEDPNLPILLSSGYSKSEVIEEAMTRDKVLFIQKPYISGDLIAKVEELLLLASN